jgi:hypothetical protein
VFSTLCPRRQIHTSGIGGHLPRVRIRPISIPVQTVGKGATEPMRLLDSSGLTQDDIYSLNRRVEWVRE